MIAWRLRLGYPDECNVRYNHYTVVLRDRNETCILSLMSAPPVNSGTTQFACAPTPQGQPQPQWTYLIRSSNNATATLACIMYCVPRMSDRRPRSRFIFLFYVVGQLCKIGSAFRPRGLADAGDHPAIGNFLDAFLKFAIAALPAGTLFRGRLFERSAHSGVRRARNRYPKHSHGPCPARRSDQ